MQRLHAKKDLGEVSLWTKQENTRPRRALDRPKITIITVCFNAGSALVMTMDNILAQQYEPLEYIIIDGGSTDNSMDEIRKREDRIDKWVSEPDKGIYDARNKGAVMATGDWVMFINAGDALADDHILERVMCIADQKADVIYGDVLKDGQLLHAHPFTNAHRMCFCHQSSLTNRAVLGTKPFDTHYKMSADFKFFKLLGLHGGRFCHVELPLSRFDSGGVSNTNRDKALMENADIVRQTDSLAERIRLLPRLYFTWFFSHIKRMTAHKRD